MNRHLYLACAATLLASSALVGCTDDKYDFDQVDLTMGFSVDSLSVPLSNSHELPLADILDLEENGSVRADEQTGWNYVFHLAGGSVAAATPTVSAIRATAQPSTVLYTVDLTALTSRVSGQRRAATTITLPIKDLASYTYTGAAEDVVDIRKATVDPTTFYMSIDFPAAMKQYVPTVKQVDLTFPDYITIDQVSGVSATVNGNDVTLTNVSTAQTLSMQIKFTTIDFTDYNKENGSLSINKEVLTIDGKIKMGLDFDADLTAMALAGNTGNLGTITARFSSSEMVVRSATGRFNPHISLDNLGSADVTGVPDFLRDGSVVCDLDNPQITLSIANDMDIAANITGQIIATKGNETLSTVTLPQIHIGKSGTTKVCICRHSTSDLVATFGAANVYAVDNISDLVRTIPDRVTISNVTATADLSEEATIEFGRTYRVEPSYEVDAPLAFGKDAVIVYQDVLDGWNDDLEDLQLSRDTYILATCDVSNRVPLNLSVEIQPLDKNGNVLSESVIRVEQPDIVLASPDGETAKVTSIKAKVTQADANAFRQLDGIRYVIRGAATQDGTSITGITLNAKKHTLRMDNIKATVVGKVIGDFN